MWQLFAALVALLMVGVLPCCLVLISNLILSPKSVGSRMQTACKDRGVEIETSGLYLRYALH